MFGSAISRDQLKYKMMPIAKIVAKTAYKIKNILRFPHGKFKR